MFDPREPAPRYSWTQPLCETCYAIVEPNRIPVRMALVVVSYEICCSCGCRTSDGIYYRIDPKSVAFPTKKK